MKNEDLRFSAFVETHDDTGARKRREVNRLLTRFEVVTLAERCGIMFSYRFPYSFKKERQFFIEKTDDLEIFYGIKLDNQSDFDPLLCLKRLDK